MNALETRTIYESGKLRIIAKMHVEDTPYEDLLPSWDDEEGKQAIEEMRRYLATGDLEYVGMAVIVYYDGAEIASDSLWGIEHGRVGTAPEGYTGPENPGDPIMADAWEITWPEYPQAGSIIGGSPLASVIGEAVSNAAKWAEANGNDWTRAALADAVKWSDPNAPARAAK